MYRILYITLLSSLIISNLFAEEDIYSYQFNLDTVVVGNIVAEGRIFPNSAVTLISIFNTYNNETTNPYIEFLDENFSSIQKISFHLNQNIKIRPLVFDLDGDSFDEVVFAIAEPNKLWYLYFDPSNTPVIKTRIFELLIDKESPKFVVTNIAPVQLDDDLFYELVLTVNEQRVEEFIVRGMWAVDIEQKEMIWENLTAVNINKSLPINIVNDNLSFLVYSGSAGNTGESLSFSNNYFYFTDRYGNKTSYNKYLEKNYTINIDTSAEDYSVDSVAFIRAVDTNNNQLWERVVGGKAITTKIDTVRINNEKKILLSVYCESNKYQYKNFLEIVNPLSGEAENRIAFQNRMKSLFHDDSRVFVSFVDGEIIKLDFEFNVLDSSYSTYTNFRYLPFARVEKGGKKLLLVQEGVGLFQNIVALNEELNIVAKIAAKGATNYLSKAQLVSVRNTKLNHSKLFSLHPVPWYNRISPTFLRNITISFLSIIVVTMFLWIITLRVSTKKIRRQKKEIENTHIELKKTTSKLIRAEKLAVYGTIASGIAHEINSPLGAIINSAQRIKSNSTSDLEKNINLIEKAGKRAKAIIEKLLISTRKSTNDNTILTEVFNDWMELSKRQFDNLGIEIISEINCNDVLAISSTELNQIFTNIFFNARDAITDNNSSVKEISISVEKKEGYCNILIKDSGPGFNSEKLENPFEAFETTKEKGKGTGLGLWVVKSILDIINGNIKIRNSEKGAEIEINIPLFETIKKET